MCSIEARAVYSGTGFWPNPCFDVRSIEACLRSPNSNHVALIESHLSDRKMVAPPGPGTSIAKQLQIWCDQGILAPVLQTNFRGLVALVDAPDPPSHVTFYDELLYCALCRAGEYASAERMMYLLLAVYAGPGTGIDSRSTLPHRQMRSFFQLGPFARPFAYRMAAARNSMKAYGYFVSREWPAVGDADLAWIRSRRAELTQEFENLSLHTAALLLRNLGYRGQAVLDAFTRCWWYGQTVNPRSHLSETEYAQLEDLFVLDAAARGQSPDQMDLLARIYTTGAQR